MAFVIRSSRDIKLNSYESTEIGPGEYYESTEETNNNKTKNKKNSYMKVHHDPPLIPFNTTSNRSSSTNGKDSTPGPGSYDTLSIDKNNKKTQEAFLTSTGMLLKKGGKNIGFLTNAKRFQGISEFEEPIPGPGEYEVRSSFSSTSPNHKKNINSQIIKNSFPNKKGNDDRVVSIPCKQNYGYQFLNGEIRMAKDPDLSYKITGEKNDSPGPGQYTLPSKWDKNMVKWKKTKIKNKTIESEFSGDPTRPNSHTDGNENRLQTNHLVFNQIMKWRENYKNLIEHNKTGPSILLSDIKYTDNPGPGFYERDFNDNTQSQFEHKSTIQNFGSKCPKFLTFNKTTAQIGPGSYFKKKNKFEIAKSNINIVPKYNHRKKENDDDIPAIIYNMKEKNQDLKIGPGSYDVSFPLVKKQVSSVTKFGSVTERFVTKTDDSVPAPGFYNPDNSGIHQKIIKPKVIGKEDENLLDDPKNKKISNRMKPPKQDVPPVGSYNPGTLTSIQYTVTSKINPYQGHYIPFNTHNRRFDYEKKSNLGPGTYNLPGAFNDILKKKPSKGSYDFGEDKFKHTNKAAEQIPGPGEYNQSSPFDWKKKSFNVLFI